MVIGTNFFSFTIGTIGTLIAALDEKERVINQNIEILREYSRKYGLPKESQEKVKNFWASKQKITGDNE